MTEDAFTDYVTATERLLVDHYCLTLHDAGIDLSELALAREQGFTPAMFVDWFARKHDLTHIDCWRSPYP